MYESHTTSWLWAHDNGVQGAVLNLEKGLIEWYDGPGCACGDSSQVQSFEDFLKQGPRYSTPPDDVFAEIQAALHSIVYNGVE